MVFPSNVSKKLCTVGQRSPKSACFDCLFYYTAEKGRCQYPKSSNGVFPRKKTHPSGEAYSPLAPVCALANRSVLFVADVLSLGGIKGQIADGRHQTVNAKGDHGQKDVRQRSGRVALRLQAGMIDDQASDPAQEKGEQETNEVIVFIHFVLLTKNKIKAVCSQTTPTEKVQNSTASFIITYFRLNVNTLKQIEI